MSRGLAASAAAFQIVGISKRGRTTSLTPVPLTVTLAYASMDRADEAAIPAR
jgi:hypothetical protein